VLNAHSGKDACQQAVSDPHREREREGERVIIKYVTLYEIADAEVNEL
jgi:hypothetical protein